MTQETYYKKDENGNFVAVSHYDSDLYDALPYGAHLIRVAPGRVATRYHVDPDNVAVIAALEYARETIVQELIEASYPTSSHTPVTKMQKEAWDNLKEAFGNDLAGLRYASPHEIADATISELEFLVDEMLSNESVKKAYEEFVLMAKLCGQEKQKKATS